jgi:toxin ParE1/3/4
MAEYRLTPAAASDLEAIWIYSAQHWGLEQANRYTDMIAGAFEELAGCS